MRDRVRVGLMKVRVRTVGDTEGEVRLRVRLRVSLRVRLKTEDETMIKTEDEIQTKTSKTEGET